MTVGNAVISGVDNSSSSQTENQKNNCLGQVKDLLVIMMVVSALQGRSSVLTLVKQRQNFA